ncbi:hypothetical protein Msi02_26740 [Microbispora siamensis]|uniref:Uncharacterized protein n=1 Tax=Microbispora siamensis TaxID=564413 RepID=A0ABQ4GKB0_9ACTN|nr:hypothetical protein Msi02_26740 [Microbispora siamensis]
MPLFAPTPLAPGPRSDSGGRGLVQPTPPLRIVALADLGAADATLAHVAFRVHYGWPVVSDRLVDLRIVAPGVEVAPLP